METSLLLVSIGDEIAAMETSAVQSVVELEDINPVPCLPEHIVGLCALRSKAITVVDCRRALGLPPAAQETEQDTSRMAVVVELENFVYGLVIDAVVDVIPFEQEPAKVRTKLDTGWARVTRGMVETPAGPAQLVDPQKLVDGPRQSRRAA